MARVLRAMTGLSQGQFAKKAGLRLSDIAGIESGQTEPTVQNLQRIAQGAGMTASDADELMHYGEALIDYRQRQDQGSEEVLPALMSRLERQLSATYLRLLALPGPEPRPQAVEPRSVEELMDRLKSCSPEVRVYLVRVAEEFQSQALCERVREEAALEGEHPEEAVAWTQIAEEIAAQLPR
jgi:transcriptional regulator with XRE-family HTH domain